MQSSQQLILPTTITSTSSSSDVSLISSGQENSLTTTFQQFDHLLPPSPSPNAKEKVEARKKHKGND